MRKFTLPLTLAAVVLALDALTKALVQDALPLYARVEIVPGFFNLVHVLNKGAAFGILSDESIGWQRAFFIVTALVAVGVIMHLIHTGHARERFGAWGLGLVLGGALGNLADRVRIGYVVDFLDFHAAGWHWPAFNVADIGITCGVGLLIVSFYRLERRAGRRPKPAGPEGS
ncbi:signal peptidase II [Desulfocurvus sp.]|jgi:signal peptidase II|uniref:signal peptidase II n=1 Tax=Desulfocurvus sp. TaxID=2871698 RepID=UPI0025C1B0B4|nr:signal peptidase II [Desulfocurvus sp.]MCK9240680.1 signal peptidase II [Desulfocurvus sp.]